MSGSSNFLVFNPPCNNQESDTAYASDSLRTLGAALDAILPSALFNKMNYQTSIMTAAIGQMMAAKGYVVNDGNATPGTAALNALAAALANIMTQADMSPYALLNSPVFVGDPQAPTPNIGDDSNNIATTAFIQNALLNGFQIILGLSGMIKLPQILGGFILQWTVSTGIPANGGPVTQTLNWVRAFPTACLSAIVSTQVATNGNVWDCLWQAVGAPTKTGITVNLEQVGDELSGNLTYALVWALGY
jgi:hypothetical protein